MEASVRLPAAEFRVRFFELLDQINEDGQEIVITKHGRPVARVSPARESARTPNGCMAGTVRVLGDIESPVLDDFGGVDDDPS